MTQRRLFPVAIAALFACALLAPVACAGSVRVAGGGSSSSASAPKARARRRAKPRRRKARREESKYKTRLLSENTVHTYIFRADGAPAGAKRKARKPKPAKKKGDEFSLFGPDDGLNPKSDAKPACSTADACSDADSL